MHPSKVLVIDVGHLHNDSTHVNKRTFRDRYPGAEFFCGWTPNRATLTRFLTGLDVVFTAETPYSPELIPLAHSMGVKVVVQPNYEFLDRNLNPDLWLAPSMWHWDDIPNPKLHLPVPIAGDRFNERTRPRTARTFLHVVGRPAVHDRNGTEQLLDALEHVKSEIGARITCQESGHVQRLLAGRRIPANVTVTVDSGDALDYWSLYDDGDVLVMPRRFGGLCLPAQEAVGAGLPVIMPDISPNNSWLPSEWLIPAKRAGGFQARTKIDLHTADQHALASMIDRFATDETFYTAAVDRVRGIAKQMSWDNLRPEYEKAFAAL